MVYIGCLAQKPQTVYSIVKDRQEFSWYETQANLWKQEVEKDSKNANAWYNYYAANRAMRNLSHSNPEKQKSYQDLCIQIVEDAYKEVPNSFEANHLKWWSAGNEKSEFKFLEKAYQINPNDPRTFVDLMTHYETEQDYENYSKFCKKYFVANELAASVLNWGYNILSEVDQNAIIFSAGDNDTYPIWVVQEEKNFRKDVKNINTYLIQIDDYRNKLFAKLGIPELIIDLTKAKTQEEYNAMRVKLYEHILINYKKGPVYVSGSAMQQFDKWSEELVLVGLSYKYTKENIDNVSIIKRNYEHRYLLDHLKEVFSYNIGNGVADRMDALYLPMMVKLYKHYTQSEERGKQADLLQLIISVSERTGQQTEISSLLDDEDKSSTQSRYITMLMNTKQLEKKMRNVSGNIWASETEVSNLDYRSFLNNLKRSRNDELYKRCIYDSTQWKERFRHAYNDPMVENYHWHPAYDNYPVVNISHEAAVEYCKWLTAQYNTQRKRTYTQVVFRLPTKSEWRLIAIPGGATDKTCFPDDKVANEKGCFLANLKVADGDYYSDGAFHTAQVSSYNPNDKGFYCVMGNAAEMIDEKGIAKGGSWYHSFEESKFDKSQKYTGPDPGVGFRVLMEVIQE